MKRLKLTIGSGLNRLFRLLVKGSILKTFTAGHLYISLLALDVNLNGLNFCWNMEQIRTLAQIAVQEVVLLL